MKRFISMALIAVMALFLLTGCGSKTAESTGSANASPVLLPALPLRLAQRQFRLR